MTPPKTLSAIEVRSLLYALNSIRALTDHLRQAHFELPFRLVYGAVGAEAYIRECLLGASLSPIAIDTSPQPGANPVDLDQLSQLRPPVQP